ncbi:tRNA lysidine(34) synthetase TilS [Candidatus Bipolaricaulota bacterium]|nr:tRNA lysidine(34) synthetase TilS [Candidatus Bipolaricaulota bacterium]
MLISVSGGIDSTVLLHVLSDLKEEFELELSVAHLDHGIRGQASARDAEFVRKEAKKMGLDSTIGKRPVEEVSEEKNLSLEEAAREIRYEFLSEVSEDLNSDYVALGHNRDDQAETILMHVIRGSGLRGLGGIEEVRGSYIRPLLKTSREEIKDYASAEELDYRRDGTNRDTSYTRNRIRHELIPELEGNYNPKIKETLTGLGSLAKEAQSFISGKAAELRKEIRTKKDEPGVHFSRDGLSGAHLYLKKVTIRQLIKEAKGDLKDVNSDHVRQVAEKLEEKPARTRLDLPGITFILRREVGCFAKNFSEETMGSFSYQIDHEDKLKLEEAGMELQFEVTPDPEKFNPDNFSADSLTEVVDWGKVERSIVVRNREPGDSFRPLGMDGEKKLKDFFIDSKVPYERRDRVPLVCDSRSIIWVVGYQIDDRYRIRTQTNKGMIMKASTL